jgi:hypothetical protein
MANSEETNLVRKIMLAMGKNPNIRIFRNNSGKCWIGQPKMFNSPQSVCVKPGDVLVQQARYFEAGLCPGSSDLIGLEAVRITPEMVGTTVAVFVAVEAKLINGRVQQNQINFLEMVNKLGGKGIICRDENNIPI